MREYRHSRTYRNMPTLHDQHQCNVRARTSMDPCATVMTCGVMQYCCVIVRVYACMRVWVGAYVGSNVARVAT